VSLSLVESEGGEDIVAEINVTPLTDIFLVLLIIFMVTSTALTQQGTKVNLPRSGRGGAESASVIITATADHRIELNSKPIAFEALLPALRSALEKAPEKHVILQGDRNVVLEEAVQIMTIAKEAGADKIAIATEPKDAKP